MVAAGCGSESDATLQGDSAIVDTHGDKAMSKAQSAAARLLQLGAAGRKLMDPEVKKVVAELVGEEVEKACSGRKTTPAIKGRKRKKGRKTPQETPCRLAT